MSKQEAVICPFCGAPYTEAIPTDTAHVKCKYCKSIILLPSNLSVVPRCPNHTDRIAKGLCSDCMGTFCSECLHIYKIKGGRIYLCPDCLKRRKTREAYSLIAIGVIMFLLSFFGLQISFLAFIGGFLLFSLPFLAGGFYTLFNLRHASNIDTYSTFKKIEERREEFGDVSPEAESLYWLLWKEYVRNMGPIGPNVLERRLHDYVNQGLTLDEAIRKLAKIEKIN